MPDPLILGRVEAYKKALKERYMLYLSEVFFPEVAGQRQPIFTEKVDERTELLKLMETKRAADLVAMGQMEPNFETEAWTQNRDGAQERLIELQRKFGEMR